MKVVPLRIVPGVICLVVILLAWSVASGEVARREPAIYSVIHIHNASKPLKQQHISTFLTYIVSQPDQAMTGSALRNVVNFSRHGHELIVRVRTSDRRRVIQALRRYGGQLRHVQKAGVIELSIPRGDVSGVADLSSWTEPVLRGVTRTGSITSAGDATMNASALRANLGVDGSGVRIGIISDGLADLQASVDSGDVPADVIIVNGRDGGDDPLNADEGRAMAEIIHDLAPGATLLFHSGFPTSLDMISAIQSLTEAGTDIIVDDLGFLTEPVFEDGPVALAVQDAIDNGVLYVTATGNSALENYRAPYREFDPGDGDDRTNLRDFGHGDATMAVHLAPGGAMLVLLQWPDSFDGVASTADYDLLLFDASGEASACGQPGLQGFCASLDAQIVTNAPPLEIVFLENTTPAVVTVNVVINRFDGAALPLQLLFSGAVRVAEHNISGG